MVFLFVAGTDVMCYEATEVWHDDAVIVQQQYFDMSSKLNHVCKGTIFFGIRCKKPIFFPNFAGKIEDFNINGIQENRY